MNRKAAVVSSSVAMGAALALVAIGHRRARSVALPSDLLPQATLRQTLRLLLGVVLPTIAKGVIIRRPRVVAAAERLDLDARAVRILQELRDTHGSGPVLVGPILGRRWAVVLRPEHVHRVLAQTPEPFATATPEKRAALSHFEPKGVLISHGADRIERRRFNEDALDYGRSTHRLGDTFEAVVVEEAADLLAAGAANGELTWERFAASWFRAVRRVVFGDGARDDAELSRLIVRLRSHANWAWLWPQQPALRRRLFDRVDAHLARAEPGSVAGLIATIPASARTAVTQQVPQWLFAFDAAALSTFRTLAVLATHRDHAHRARREVVTARHTPGPHEHPYLRACVLDVVRLWPTTPLLLRDATAETSWENGVMPACTTVTIYAPFFHRDERRVPFANRFAPEVWLHGRVRDWALVPFSGGPAACPGRDLVLMLASTMLAALLNRQDIRLTSPQRLSARRPLPATLDPYSLRFRFSAHVTHPT
jgi:cytochrome P450